MLRHVWRKLARDRILSEQGHKCCYCGCPLTRSTATLEHVQPVSKMGGDWEGNLRVACQPCNYGRGNVRVSKFRRVLKSENDAEHWPLRMAQLHYRLERRIQQACKAVRI